MSLGHFFFRIVFVFSLSVAVVQAAPLPMVYPASLIRVIDGDTVKLRLEIYPGLSKEVNLRIFGIDAPESRNGVKAGQKMSECEIVQGKKAKAIAQSLLMQSPTLMVTNIDPERSKYAGRINGQLLFVLPGTEAGKLMDFGLYMIEQGLAKRYQGGVRSHWPCQ